MSSKKEQKPKASVCQGCMSWKVFGHKCYFYWEQKKECSQFRKNQSQEPTYKEDNEHRDWKQMTTLQIV